MDPIEQLGPERALAFACVAAVGSSMIRRFRIEDAKACTRVCRSILSWTAPWCDTEKKAAWAALLGQFPAPRVVITDGGSGIARPCLNAGPIPRCSVAWSMSSATCAPPDRPAQDGGR